LSRPSEALHGLAQLLRPLEAKPGSGPSVVRPRPAVVRPRTYDGRDGSPSAPPRPFPRTPVDEKN
ncbi:hypothetical protein AB0N21_35200, partial [Streptomyces sp. NPDC051080]|uniref:hypothetical protein n=1 Tax=Streptomyces sp. NPDC051080 TaxID=3157222 RepID=UPI00341583D8